MISIGTLSRNELWEEAAAVRTAHATTTLIRAGKQVILVDPALPAPALGARLFERAGLKPEQITDVFLTNFRPAHRWGLPLFESAKWWISEAEREAVGRALIDQFQHEQDEEAKELMRRDIETLKRCQNAPDKLAPQVDLFPLPGFTPGTCGLLLPMPTCTVLVAGDAVATGEHMEMGRVLRGAYDAQQAQESLREAVEIADVIIPGHDNVRINLSRRGF
ncbi:MAG: MBL fold metallo-hydrolase [Phycisphaeraceae bacterium]|nr:MBL fold metallo-hydrolase [Phycisphaeraceae bacterium]